MYESYDYSLLTDEYCFIGDFVNSKEYPLIVSIAEVPELPVKMSFSLRNELLPINEVLLYLVTRKRRHKPMIGGKRT